MKKTILIAMSALILSGCASPYLGKRLSMHRADVCKFDSLPAQCSVSDKNFAFKFTIDETGEDQEYRVSGSATYIGGQTWNSFTGLSFTLLLIDNSTIVDTVSMSGGSGSLDSKVRFSRDFKTDKNLEAGAMSYYTKVSG